MDSTAGVFFLFIIIVIIVLIVAVYVGKDRIFTKGTNLGSLSQEELNNLGYGTYIQTGITACITSDGKCLTAGLQTITETCQPNATTGKGCINELGEQTFQTRNTRVTCQPNCRKYILTEDTTFNQGGTCKYDEPFNESNFSCLPINARSYIYKKYNCVDNDSTGDNRCTYQCSGGGIDSSGSFADSDPSKLSYIPLCATNPGATVKLKTISGNILNNIPSDGLSIKGYTITNIIVNGEPDPENFRITPAYRQWNGPTGTISRADLIDLDSTLITYNNCIPSDSKPYCDGTYYYFQPSKLPGDNDYNFKNTSNPTPSYCELDYNFTPLRDCFYNPWYAPIGVYNDSYITGNTDTASLGTTGLKFNNPYVGGAGTAKYSWTGIGNYGYIYSGISCMPNSKNLTTQNPDGSYPIPLGSTGGASCLNLNATVSDNLASKLCSTSLTNLFTNPLNLTFDISQVIGQAEGNPNFGFQAIQEYPQKQNTSNFVCASILPDGTKQVDSSGNPVQGCVKTCRYQPDYYEINYDSLDMNGKTLPLEYRDLIGKSVNLNFLDSSGKNYFLSINNTPCSAGKTGTFLYNCRGTAPYNSVPCIYVYDGGGGMTGGQYWSKNDCDSESIVLTSSLNLIFSPYQRLDNSLDGSYNIQCDIYANFGAFNGYLSPGTGSTINLTNISQLANFFAGNNIIANNPGTSSLTYNPLPAGQQIPRSANNSQPFFILNYNPSTEIFTIYPSTFANEIYTIFYNGVEGNNKSIASFVTSTNKTNGQGYYISRGFNDPIIKTSGLYAGKDVTYSINTQRTSSCYNKSTCQQIDPTITCYPKTCNLFYEYNPDYC